MRSKAPLAMMEQMIMLLVFALAAALCLQAFVKSDAISTQNEARDRAVLVCQTAAETLRSTGGDFARTAELLGVSVYDNGSLMADYDEDWNIAENTMRYTMGASRVDSGVTGLGKASVWVRDEAEGLELFRIEIAWQEVELDG